ncbi:MAG: hypothetical protein K2Q03_07905 [Sphingobacteriaceae bacterium]|nr:hypothetical protein [Sphingobacteriaceae bacterium]
MNYKLQITNLITYSLLGMCLMSCKKEDTSSQNEAILQQSVKLVDNRLNFQSEISFKNMIESLEGNPSKNKYELVEKISGISNFNSMSESLSVPIENLTSSILTSKSVNSSNRNSFTHLLKMSTSPNNNLSIQEGEKLEELVDEVRELVPDENFASVLNSNLEVSVANSIYKITPYGTFIVKKEKYAILEQLLNNKSYTIGQDLSKDAFYTNRISDNTYQIEPGIVLFDTYNVVNGKKNEVMQIKDYTVDNNISGNKIAALNNDFNTDFKSKTKLSNVYNPNSEYNLYNNIPTITFGAKTAFGKFWAKLFGRNEEYIENFEKKRRVRVNFHNISWVFYSSMGISVTMEKKNWIGWSGTEATELRLGWDAMEYSIGDIPQTLPAPISTQAQRFTPVDFPFLSQKYVQVNLLGYPFVLEQNKSIQEGIKGLYDLLPKVSFLKPKNQRNVNYAYTVWGDLARKSVVTVLDRDEIIKTNSEKITKNLGKSFAMEVSWDFKNALNVKPAVIKFNISKASIFGVAKYGNVWKGARIVTN